MQKKSPMNQCKLCEGTEGSTVVVKHPYSNISVTKIEWCLCAKARYVSQSPNYKIISQLGSDYLPLEEIDPQLNFYPPPYLAKTPNLIIQSDDFNLFCMHIKSVIIKHRFNDPPALIYACRSIDILQTFYVEQGDGTAANLSDLNKFDLLIFTLDSKEKNSKLNTCISQVVYSRKCLKRPTWIYLPGNAFDGSNRDIFKAALSKCEWEYSPDLEELLWSFKKIQLGSGNKVILKKTKAAQKAENFRV